MPKEKFFITTAIDYVNDTIHLGHAFQKVIADVLARFYRLKLGDSNVFFLTGTDEHGQKVEKAAQNAQIPVKDYVDEIAQSDKLQQNALNISYNRFIRTTDKDHLKVAQEIWQRVNKNGDIYLGEFSGLYCSGCEAYYSEDELINGRCPLHPNLKIQKITEKNFFFRWSKYQDFLIKNLEENPNFVFPESRRNEMLAFAKKGIHDIPISRTSFQWGIPVPNEPNHVMYVWFDALTNYLTGVGFLENSDLFNKFWPADIHILGKDNLRWHALLWPAMLKSAGIELPKTILVNGFLTLNGQKISKSTGNIIRPTDWVKKYGADAVRFYLLRHRTIIEDSDISEEKLKSAYKADLAHGLGNYNSRVLTLIVCDPKIQIHLDDLNEKLIQEKVKEIKNTVDRKIEEFKLNEALAAIWELISFGDKYLNENEVWKISNVTEKSQKLANLIYILLNVAELLKPFLPQTSEKILSQIEAKNNKCAIKKIETLFPKI